MSTEPIYFGCPPGHPAGHYYFRPDAQRAAGWPATSPWGEVDGLLTPKIDGTRQGGAALHHKDGWTALAFHDFRGDSRGGSNTVVLIPQPDLDFDAAIAAATEAFPRWMDGAAVHEVPTRQEVSR